MAAAARNNQQIAAGAIAAQHRCHDPAAFGAHAHHDGPGAIPEQHAGVAVGPIDEARERFGADDQYVFGEAGAHGVGGLVERVDEAGAACAQVIRAGIGCADRVLHQTGCRWEEVFRRDRGNDHQIEATWLQVGDQQRFASRARRPR